MNRESFLKLNETQHKYKMIDLLGQRSLDIAWFCRTLTGQHDIEYPGWWLIRRGINK